MSHSAEVDMWLDIEGRSISMHACGEKEMRVMAGEKTPLVGSKGRLWIAVDQHPTVRRVTITEVKDGWLTYE